MLKTSDCGHLSHPAASTSRWSASVLSKKSGGNRYNQRSKAFE